ncbi:MAG: DoxX family protein [Micrococcales bacterium]|nr:MAG: DoxX family protein [Micrococcales bacterium]PIE27141.1 MAG: DoxX family protein [Micrococcales bacterium]
MWFMAAKSKLPDPDASVRSVRAFRLLPEALAVPVGLGLPVLELALAVLIGIGIFTRVSSVVTVLLMVAFTIGIASVWQRGLSIDCGCFGGGGQVDPGQTRYPQEIARDILFALFGAYLVWRPDTLWSMDRRLGLTGR